MQATTIKIALLLTSALVSCGLAPVVWRRARDLASGPPLVAMLAALAWWSFTYALVWAGAPAPFPLFWLNVTYCGVVAVPTSILLFAIEFTNRGHLLTRTAWVVLAIEPVVTLVGLWTDHGNGLFFPPSHGHTLGAILTGGPLFWGNVAYSYALIVLTFGLLLREFLGVAGVYRRQVRTFLLGILASWAVNLVSLSPLNPFRDLDLTSFAFTLTGACLAYGLFRYQMLDLMPVARSLLVEHMQDGLLVLDQRGRIVDHNPALVAMVGVSVAEVAGQWPATALPRLPLPWADYAAVCEPLHQEVTLPRAAEGQEPAPARGRTTYLDVHVLPLAGRSRRGGGALVVLRDVTARKEDELALRQAYEQVQRQLEEIRVLQHHLEEQARKLEEQAQRDPLTGLYNRRSLYDALARELAIVGRQGGALSLVMIDVDHFKRVNDTFGHPGGDAVLTALARLLSAETRASDVVCRYGGEEFVVILPGATCAQAEQRAEDWRQAFGALRVEHGGRVIQTTLSAGVATHGGSDPDSAEELIRRADVALYRAKEGGRNRVVVCAADGDAAGHACAPA